MTRNLGWISALAFFAIIPTGQGGKEVRIESKFPKDPQDFYVGNELVARYHPGGYAKPIFWPVNAPGGIALTRNYPPPDGQAKDHPHQKSAWFCHGDVIPEGIELKDKINGIEGVDFWSEAKGHGKIVPLEASSHWGHNAARTWCSFAQVCEWRTNDGKKIMDEKRTIHLHEELGKNARLIVVDIDLHASVCPITFGDTKEGSFGVRINDVINAATGKGKIQNADGKIGEKECWGQRSAWCDYSGPIDGKVVGLAIFDDPKNAYPACWHVRGYGLMAANPFGRAKHAKFPGVKGNNDLVRLKKGEHLQLRYGMLLHTGDAVTGEVAEHYKRFVELRAKENHESTKNENAK
jgi:Methane oxygenase PmoA